MTMIRFVAAVSTIALLSACDEQPFTFSETPVGDETEDNLDPTDPNVTASSRFAYDREAGLTLNSIEYDAANDELVINNLPFDGPEGRYDYMAPLGGGAAYESRQTATTGIVKHFAVFIESEHIQAGAAAGADWGDFGYGGANITRDEFSLPQDGEYVYLGDYVGVRTFSDRGGLELVSGDVSIILDVNDFDPIGGIQGAITGTISNRSITGTTTSVTQGLQNVNLLVVEFTTTDGTFDGTSDSLLANGDDGSSGIFEGFLAGPESTQIGANIVLSGTAYSQEVTYQVIEYEIPNGSGGVTTGQVSGLSSENVEVLQDGIDAGQFIPMQVPTLPTGATATNTYTLTQLFTSEYDAREIGVLVGTVVVP